jgi:hypothetical protein
MEKLEKNILVLSFIAMGLGFIMRGLRIEGYPMYLLAVGGALLIASGLIHGLRSIRKKKN